MSRCVGARQDGRAQSSVERTVRPFLPVDADAEVRPLGTRPTADVCIWVCPPIVEASRAEIARGFFARREQVALARANPPEGYRVVGVHPVPPPVLHPGVGGPGVGRTIARRVRSGFVAELHRGGVHRRMLDEIDDARSRVRITSTGTVLLLRPGSILRIDEPRHAEALAALAGDPLVPELLDSGNTEGLKWSVETALPGRRPSRLTPELGRRVAVALATLPRSQRRPRGFVEDIWSLRRSYPAVAGAWDDVARRLETLRSPAVARHGDLRLGKLLCSRGRLTGIVDWDAWHPAGVAGTDLLHLWAARAETALGATYLERPWRSSGFADLARPYWKLLGYEPDAEALDVIGLAWWVGRAAAAIECRPELLEDRDWYQANLARVLAELV